MTLYRRQRCGASMSASARELKALVVLLAAINCLQPQVNAHFIHIDHNEFRASGFPRPLPPPLPPPIEKLPQQVPARELSPVELMVDLSNALTYRILHYHSILNRNNFAFSPTALMSVLVALYEGSAGRSATELRNVLQLPNNRDVVRVGYRDIHRRLRTYFFESDNPLKGLSLNKENVTITRDYETILKFYGYDLGMDMVSSTMQPTTTMMPTTTTAIPPTLEADTTTTTTATTTTTKPETQTTIEITTLPTTTTTTTTTTTAAPSTASTITTIAATTQELVTTEEVTTTTTKPVEEATTVSKEEDTTKATTESSDTTTTTATADADAETTTEAPAPAAESENAELVAIQGNEASLAAPFQRLQKTRTSHMLSKQLQAPPVSFRSGTAPKLNYLPQRTHADAHNVRQPRRHKRHLFDIKELDAGLFVTLFNTPTQAHQHLYGIHPPVSTPVGISHVPNEFEVETLQPHFLHTADTKQNYGYNTDIISHVFYLNNQQIVHTTFKVYNAVLYFKYFDHLKMSVLELELDTPEYNLMILLPDYQVDLVSAAASLRLGPALQVMRKQLKPRWVQAIIPDFRLHGLMFLTNDLQNMGICDVFEPNRADFRPMTDEKGIYVKHIEQSINVHIRTRPINQLKRNYDTQSQPIQISVNHPFLFFIIDRDLDVAVMAGRIINPLNVRIQ